MTDNPMVARIQELLDDCEANPKVYVRALLDSLPVEVMAFEAQKLFLSDDPSVTAYAIVRAAIAAARATVTDPPA